MTSPSLADLRYAFWGSGAGNSVSDAEYQQLLSLYGLGITMQQIAKYDGHRTFPAIAGRLGGGAVLHADVDVPRVTLPDGVDSSVTLGPFGLPGAWYGNLVNGVRVADRITSGFEYVNDHTLTTGNIRFRFQVRQNDQFVQAVASPTFKNNQTWNSAGSIIPVGNEGIIIPPAGDPFEIVNGVLGSKFVLKIERLGSDGVNDTFTGPISITSGFFLRADLPT